MGVIFLGGKSPRWVIIRGVHGIGGRNPRGKNPRGVIIQGVNGMGVKVLGGNSPRG